MGEETASQVQDVVVAGSQSSNFLLPKENKSWSAGVPRLTIAGLCSDSGQPNKAFRGYCPFCWSAGSGPRGRLVGCFNTHTHTHLQSVCLQDRVREFQGQVLLYIWPHWAPAAAAQWALAASKPNPALCTAPIRVYYCISANSCHNKPCPIVMIVLASTM